MGSQQEAGSHRMSEMKVTVLTAAVTAAAF